MYSQSRIKYWRGVIFLIADGDRVTGKFPNCTQRKDDSRHYFTEGFRIWYDIRYTSHEKIQSDRGNSSQCIGLPGMPLNKVHTAKGELSSVYALLTVENWTEMCVYSERFILVVSPCRNSLP